MEHNNDLFFKLWSIDFNQLNVYAVGIRQYMKDFGDKQVTRARS